MGKILKEIFGICPDFNNKNDLLFNREEIQKWNRERSQKIREFKILIRGNKELLQAFDKLFVEIDEINNCRDIELSQLFIVQGMKIYMQFQSEILTN